MNPLQITSNKMSQSRSPRARKWGKAQGLVEFAIVLPILLLLIFGLIEFARIFQAWLSVTNSARFGLRYAVTGEFNQAHCQDLNGNGLICNAETDRTSRYAEIDHARLGSIYDVSRNTAIGPLINDAATKGQPGFFKVTVCSSMAGFSYHQLPDDFCAPHDDAGDPEGGTVRVMVGVTYQHQLIMPFLSSIWPSVTLHAERTGILEQFRTAPRPGPAAGHRGPYHNARADPDVHPDAKFYRDRYLVAYGNKDQHADGNRDKHGYAYASAFMRLPANK